MTSRGNNERRPTITVPSRRVLPGANDLAGRHRRTVNRIARKQKKNRRKAAAHSRRRLASHRRSRLSLPFAMTVLLTMPALVVAAAAFTTPHRAKCPTASEPTCRRWSPVRPNSGRRRDRAAAVPGRPRRRGDGGDLGMSLSFAPPIDPVAEEAKTDFSARGCNVPRRLRRHPVFRDTNVHVVPSLPTLPAPNPWKSLVPAGDRPFSAILNPRGGGGGKIGVDASVVFDDPRTGARSLLDATGLLRRSGARAAELEDQLFEALSRYQRIVSPSSGAGRKKRCKARIVSSLGTRGTKCPRWHVDHVNCRLVMSLLGPGCAYVPFETERRLGPGAVNRDALNGLDVTNTVEANRIIVPREEEIKVEAREGAAVMLMGRGWEENPFDDNDGGVLAAVHRSPRLGPFQGRVLLTVDEVVEGNELIDE